MDYVASERVPFCEFLAKFLWHEKASLAPRAKNITAPPIEWSIRTSHGTTVKEPGPVMLN